MSQRAMSHPPVLRAARFDSVLPLLAFAFCWQTPIQVTEELPLRWDRSLDVALAEAKKASTFVFVALPADYDGEGHGALSGAFWNHKGLRKAAAAGRCVVGSASKHAEHEGGFDRDLNAMERSCSRFGQLLCDQHLEVEKQTIARYFEGFDPAVRPVFLVLRGSDGKVIARRLGDPTATELAETLTIVASLLKAGGDPAVPNDLIGRTQDSDATIRARALRVLGSLEFEAADAARKKALEDAKDEKGKAEVLIAMAETGSRTLKDVALSQLDSKSAVVRAAAARALGGSGMADAVDPLIKAFAKAKDDEEKKWIVRSLSRCARQSEAGKEMLRKSTSDNKALVRANACVALGEALAGDPAALKLLKQRAETDPEPKVRGAAVLAISVLRGADIKETTAYLKARKPKEKDLKVAEMLANGVGFLEGTLDNDLSWAYTSFCGDPPR